MEYSTLLVTCCVCFSCHFIYTSGISIEDSQGSVQTNRTIKEGSSITVVCNITRDINDTFIYWTKNGTSNVYEEGIILEFKNITRMDAGVYICHTHASYLGNTDTDADVIVEVVSIDVLYAAEVKNMTLFPDELKENQTYSISCEVDGNPNPIWSIRNNYRNIELMSARKAGYVNIGPLIAQCEDAGYWECTGYNNISDGVNSTMGQNMTVFCSPRPNPLSRGESYTVVVAVGMPANFVMNVVAYPSPDYEWSRDDGLPMPDTVAIHNYPWVTIWNNSQVEVGDFGNYTLIMENGLGVYTARYSLVAYGAPEQPTNFCYSDVTFDTVTLYWTSGYDMGSPQYFVVMSFKNGPLLQLSPKIYDNSTNHGIGQNWTYKVTGLYSNALYQLTLIAENTQGYRSKSAKPYIRFTTKENPDRNPDKSDSSITIVIATVGSLASLAILVAVVIGVVKYMRKRNMHRKYEDLN